jgi:molybdopterin/thiamine biosynthesis adenylyltransferase
MRRKHTKLPDGKFAEPRVSKLEQYLKARALVAANAPIAPRTLPRSAGDSPADFGMQCLSGCEIIIFGAGSVGSYLAPFVTVADLILHVVDFKRVEDKHLIEGRTTYTAEDLGQFKVEALKRRIEADHPGTQVRSYPCNVAQFTDADLTAMFRRCLIAILAIDDPEQIIRIGDLAYPLVQQLQAAMHARGHSSHIIISMPHVTPCLRCTLGIRNPHDIRRLDRERAHSLDIVNLAQNAATFALDLACSKVTGQRITRWDVSKNRIYITTRRDSTVSPDGPGLYFERAQRRPWCPVCMIGSRHKEIQP